MKKRLAADETVHSANDEVSDSQIGNTQIGQVSQDISAKLPIVMPPSTTQQTMNTEVVIQHYEDSN